MRGLSAGLLAAQRSVSREPNPTISVGGDNYTSRRKGLRHMERPYGGRALITLDNHDKGILDDLRGKEVNISYGFNGEDVSESAPLWVLTQRNVSQEGVLVTQLDCIDIWLKLAMLRVIGAGGIVLKGTITGTFQPGMKVTGQTSGATATVHQAGEAYIAVMRVARDFSVGETVTYDLSSGINVVVDTATEYGGGPAPGWNGDKTILQIIQELTDGIVSVELDDSDGIVDVYPPNYITENNTPLLTIIQDLMDKTTSAIRMGNDGKLHIFNFASPPGSPDYSYDTVHAFFSDIRDVSSVLPNRIIVINAMPTVTDMTTYAGSAIDAAAYARFGLYVTQILVADVQSDPEATAVAEARLNRVQKESTKGELRVPMNCGQELFDYIKVTDSRADVTFYGWVGSLEHRWEEGVYELTIGLGNLTGAEGLPDDAEYPLPPLAPSFIPPPAQVGAPFEFLPAYLPIVIDLVFTAVDWDDVSWSSGTIKCADGTTFSVNAGYCHLYNDSPYFLYYQLNDPNLKITQNFLDATTAERILIAFLKRAPETNQDALIIPATGGSTPTWNQEVMSAKCITADEIYVNLLSAITANLGLINAGEIRLGTGDLNATEGTATGGSTTTLEDDTKSWAENELANQLIRIVWGDTIYERYIVSNTGTVITFSPALSFEVWAGETYYLGGGLFSGWRMWVEANIGRIAGFQNGSIRWYSGSDGKLTIIGYLGDPACLDIYLGAVKVGELSSATGIGGSGAFMLRSLDGASLMLLAYGAADIILGANQTDRAVRPQNTNYQYLGTINYQWKGGYFASRMKIPVGTDMYD